MQTSLGALEKKQIIFGVYFLSLLKGLVPLLAPTKGLRDAALKLKKNV